MSVIDILTVGMKGFEIALRLWDQYQYRKDALKHVQMYMTKLQMYQHAFQSLVDHVQKQITNNPSIINDPTWKQDLQLFLEYAKEDQIESQRLESDLKEAHHHPWYKKQTWTKDENRIHEKIQMITWFTTSDLWRSKQEELTKFTKLLTEPEARSFWISEIGAEHDISLEVISSKLQHYLREHQWLSSERNYDTHLGQILRHTADVILPNGRISAKEWNNFVVRFGPIDGHMLTKATSVCVLDSPHHAPQPWFVTHDDRLRLTSAFDAAKAAYDATHPDEVAALATATASNSAMSPKQKSSLYRFSTWALRFSQVATEPFVWSFWIGIRPQPQHFLIRNSAEGYYLKDAVGTESFRYHDTPVELIAYHSKKLAPGLHVDISHLQQWKEFFAPPAPPESRYACSGEIEILEGDDVELDHVEIGMTTTTTTTGEGQTQETTVAAAIITEVTSTTTSTASTAPAASEPTPATKPEPESSPIPTPVASAPEPESTPTPTPSALIPEQPTYTSSQTIIETKSRVAHEQNMIIIIDRIEEVKPDSVKPVVDTNVTSPASTTTSSPSSTARSDSDPDLVTAKSAAAAADALEKAKDITIVTPDPRASKPKPVADDDTRRGPVEPTPKPVKTCCMIM